MAHAFQHAREQQNQIFQRQNWQRLPDSLHSTDGGGRGRFFFARRLIAQANFSGIPSGLNGGRSHDTTQ